MSSLFLESSPRQVLARVSVLLIMLSLSLTLFLGCSSDSPTEPGGSGPSPVLPTASFQHTPQSGSAPLTVQFTDTSEAGSSPITAWLWDFGDGSGSSDQNPSHIYTSDGTHGVTLRVTTKAGSHTTPTPRNVAVATVTIPPEASFTRFPATGPPPLNVQFTDTSAAGSHSITAWLWDFGDGSSSTEQHPTHEYVSDGNYNITLRVTTAVANSTTPTPKDVVVASERIIDSSRADPNSPSLPEPALFNSILPAYSQPLMVREGQVRQFYPIVEQLVLMKWNSTRSENDCAGRPIPARAMPASILPQWYTSIPERSSADLRQWTTGNYNDGWPGAFPTRILLIGQLDDPGHTYHGQSFDLGGFARWQSCEERTPFLQDYFTSYETSHGMPLSSWPVMRHYKLWKKVGEIGLTGGTSSTQEFKWMSGVSTTDASEFSVSVTATAGVAGPSSFAELSATISATLSHSRTFSKEAEFGQTFTADPTARPGYNLKYSAWALVDRFVIEGPARGSKWSDPNYLLAPGNDPAFTFETISKTTYALQSAWFLKN